MPIAKPVGDLGAARCHMQRDRLSIALDDKRHRHAWVHADDLLDVLEALDIGAVDIRDDIAGMDFARFGRAARLDLANFWRGERLTVGREQDCEDDDRENPLIRSNAEVVEWPGLGSCSDTMPASLCRSGGN